MSGELLLASVAMGLFGGWLFGLVMEKGRYGVLGDLSLGLIGGSLAVWIYQAVDLVAYAGIVGGMIAAFMGAVGVVFAQRRLRYGGA
jgi:uncharacterized membrane protein YeaQ/YmgE (transglycosylase-associated protein family)